MSSDTDAAVRYAGVGVSEQPSRPGVLAQVRAALAAPVLGSALLFPRRFDAAVARARSRSAQADVPPRPALWYFGAALRLWIDPRQLRWRLSDFVSDGRSPRWIGSSFLDAADWTAALAELDRSPVHREMVELVAAELNFEETSAYGKFLRRARKGRPYTRNGIVLADREQVDGYFRYCAELAGSLKAHGMVPRRELDRRGTGWAKHAAARPRMIDLAERDVGVAVAENGGLVRHLGGKHRTALALALELPLIPVEVRLVHVGWLIGVMERTGLPAHRALPEGLADAARSWSGKGAAEADT